MANLKSALLFFPLSLLSALTGGVLSGTAELLNKAMPTLNEPGTCGVALTWQQMTFSLDKGSGLALVAALISALSTFAPGPLPCPIKSLVSNDRSLCSRYH